MWVVKGGGVVVVVVAKKTREIVGGKTMFTFARVAPYNVTVPLVDGLRRGRPGLRARSKDLANGTGQLGWGRALRRRVGAWLRRGSEAARLCFRTTLAFLDPADPACATRSVVASILASMLVRRLSTSSIVALRGWARGRMLAGMQTVSLTKTTFTSWALLPRGMSIFASSRRNFSSSTRRTPRPVREIRERRGKARREGWECGGEAW